MSEKPRCSHPTTRGRPCRNPAVPGSEPPACGKHGGITNQEGETNDEGATNGRQMVLPGMETVDRPQTTDDRPPATNHSPLPTDPLPTDPPLPRSPSPLPPFSPSHLYFPRPTAAEQRVLAATAEELDLQPEVELVRLVLRRLLAHLDESAGELPPEETRRVAALLFTGARTIALLLGKRPPARPEMEEWMEKALREMKDNYELRITNYEL